MVWQQEFHEGRVELEGKMMGGMKPVFSCKLRHACFSRVAGMQMGETGTSHCCQGSPCPTHFSRSDHQ